MSDAVLAAPARPRLGLALALIGAALAAIPLVVFVYARLVALAIAGSIAEVAGALGMTLGGWTGTLAPEDVGAIILTASVALLALPGIALLWAGVALLRRARIARGAARL